MMLNEAMPAFLPVPSRLRSTVTLKLSREREKGYSGALS